MNTVYCSLLRKSIFNLCDLSSKPTGSSSSGLYGALNKAKASAAPSPITAVLSCPVCSPGGHPLFPPGLQRFPDLSAAALLPPSTNPEEEHSETATWAPIPEVFLEQLYLLGIVSGYSEELIMVKVSDPACRNSASDWRLSSTGWDSPSSSQRSISSAPFSNTSSDPNNTQTVFSNPCQDV